MRLYTILLASFMLFLGCTRQLPDTLVDGGYDEQEMNAAISRARSEVDSFLIELTNPDCSDHSVKAPIRENDDVEHFWLTDITFANGEFEGLIGNDPGIVTSVKFGQKVKVAKSEISDWMYMKEGKMHGNYTMRPLLRTLPEDQADKLRSILAVP